jgi:hypothetical protein
LEGFAQAYGGKLPELKERARTGGQAGNQLTVLAKPDDADSAQSLWDDDLAAAFYQHLPDLSAAVPSVALRCSQEGGTVDEGATEAPGSAAGVADSSEAVDGAALIPLFLSISWLGHQVLSDWDPTKVQHRAFMPEKRVYST